LALAVAVQAGLFQRVVTGMQALLVGQAIAALVVVALLALEKRTFLTPLRLQVQSEALVLL
jgi:hypothetical protein